MSLEDLTKRIPVAVILQSLKAFPISVAVQVQRRAFPVRQPIVHIMRTVPALQVASMYVPVALHVHAMTQNAIAIRKANKWRKEKKAEENYKKA